MLKNKNVLAKFKVECTFKYFSPTEDNFMVKIRQKALFLSSIINNVFLIMQLAKQARFANFQPVLKTSVFSTLGATLMNNLLTGFRVV